MIGLEEIDERIISRDSAKAVLDFLDNYCIEDGYRTEDVYELKNKIDSIPDEIKQILFSKEYEFIGRVYDILEGYPVVTMRYYNKRFYVKKTGFAETISEYAKTSDMLKCCKFCYSPDVNPLVARLKAFAKE